MSSILTLLLKLSMVLTISDTANILAIFPFPSYSHQMPLLRLTYALAARGHNLTVITANPNKVPITNHTEIDVSFGYQLFKQGTLGIQLQSKLNSFKVLGDGVRAIVRLVEVQLKSPQLKNFMRWAKDVKYELVLYESLWMTPYLGLTHKLGSPPVIGLSTFENNMFFDSMMGSPSHPAYVPNLLPFTDQMVIFERIQNLIFYFWIIYWRDWLIFPIHNQIIRDIFGEGIPDAYELESNKSLLMYSSDISYPQPVTPNIIHLGPLHIVPPKPLPEVYLEQRTGCSTLDKSYEALHMSKDLKKWVSGSTLGVIYFSLGTNMQGTSLPQEIRNAFLSAFGQFINYRVIWKWDEDIVFPGQPGNILFKKWLPQQDLFANGNVKVFITQGGLQSIQEAIHYSVPLICIPLFADQSKNTRRMVETGAAVEIDFNYLTHDTIVQALQKVLNNKRYYEKMKYLSSISKDKFVSPLDQGIWWVEHVLRHNGVKHLRPATLDLHWAQYLLLDVTTCIVCIIVVLLLAAYKLSQYFKHFFIKPKIENKLKKS